MKTISWGYLFTCIAGGFGAGYAVAVAMQGRWLVAVLFLIVALIDAAIACGLATLVATEGGV